MAAALFDPASSIGDGAFVGIVGPSGAGKDTVLALAGRLLGGDPSIVFAQRVVNREPDSTERNAHLSSHAMDVVARNGGFALSWEAHGLSYGVPVQIDDEIAKGLIVVVNVSRSVVPALRRRYTRARVVLIDAPLALRRARLARRGRESIDAIDGRIEREVDGFGPDDADFKIDNSGELADAAQLLAAYLAGLAMARAREQSA